MGQVDTSNMSPEEISKLQQENCIFCKIAKGEIPAKIMYKDDKCTAFLDINPATLGHILLVPNKHYPLFPQIPDKVRTHLMMIAKRLSQSCLKGLKDKDCGGTSIMVANGAIAGQRAPHALIHVIPRYPNDKLSNFQLPENKIDDEQQGMIANVIIKKINETLGKEIPFINTKQIRDDNNKQTEQKPSTKTEEPVQIKPEEIKEKEIAPQVKKENIEPKKTIQQKPAAKEDNKTDLDKISKLFGV